MNFRQLGGSSAIVLAVWLGSSVSQAQLFQPNAGIAIDSKGVLRTVMVDDPTGELTRKRLAEAKAALNPRVAAKSSLRKVSLNRLERALQAELDAGRKPTDEMNYLAGMTRLEYVFFYPDRGEIVVGGPAEGWAANLAGRVIGLESGWPVLQLQDLIVALHRIPACWRRSASIGCSIDPTPEGLARMQKFLKSIGTQADPNDPQYTQFIVDGLRTSLGPQKVRIYGVPPTTHFAQIMVEADYRMKLIGIGLEIPPVRIASYVDRVDPGTVSRNAMQRWWFVPDYKCARVSDDKLAMQLVGSGVKLLNEDEVVDISGRRHAKGTTSRASAAFVKGFTQEYPQLATRHAVYGQLRNIIDMAVAAAFIQQQGYYQRSGWKLPLLGDEQKFPVQTQIAPVEVETAVGSRWKGSRLMTPVGGGVLLVPHQALIAENRLADEEQKVEKKRQEINPQKIADGQWWWD